MGDTDRMMKYTLDLKYLKPKKAYLKERDHSSQCSTEDISSGMKVSSQMDDGISSAISISGKSLKSDKSGMTGSTNPPKEEPK
jgi:hypothetical protein